MMRCYEVISKNIFKFIAITIASISFAGGTIEIDDNHSISVGAGLRTGLTSVDGNKGFNLQSMRLYVNGSLREKVKFTFNTECVGCGDGGDIGVLDAILQFEMSPELNIWVGRMLTPADRIELNGPYYALSWNQYTVPLLPSDQTGAAGLFGRDDGVTVWGARGKLQYAAGLFDGLSNRDSLLFAGRLAYNFLSMEKNPGYYTSSTYYGGGGDIFTIGISFQSQSDGAGTAAEPSDFSAFIVDGLFEKVLSGGGVVTVEGEYKSFDNDMTATAMSSSDCFCLFDGSSYFFTAAYLFPNEAGVGKLQPYIRRTSNEPDFDGASESDLTEIGVNYIINAHNLRVNMNFTDGDANLTGMAGADVDGFSVGFQIQI
tara:strand:+ start:307 stop:1422 length:1116 start_codon:yes stop_codon:yes gene_type:complete